MYNINDKGSRAGYNIKNESCLRKENADVFI